MKRLILITLIMLPLYAQAAGLYGIRASQAAVSEQAFRFRVAVEPLLDAEWWASVAVSCRLRSPAWLISVEVSIDDEAAVAAGTIWKGSSEQVGSNINAFVSAQKDFHDRATSAPTSECGVLRSAGELDELDQMAGAHYRAQRGRFFSNWSTANAAG